MQTSPSFAPSLDHSISCDSSCIKVLTEVASPALLSPVASPKGCFQQIPEKYKHALLDGSQFVRHKRLLNINFLQIVEERLYLWLSDDLTTICYSTRNKTDPRRKARKTHERLVSTISSVVSGAGSDILRALQLKQLSKKSPKFEKDDSYVRSVSVSEDASDDLKDASDSYIESNRKLLKAKAHRRLFSHDESVDIGKFTFAVIFTDGHSLDLETRTQDERKVWVDMMRWLDATAIRAPVVGHKACDSPKRRGTVSKPFGFKHNLHLDEDLTWRSSKENLQEVFQCKELIGEGSFGEVYRARYLNLTTVAVKKLNCEEANVDDFKAEIDILKQCKHPNIVMYMGYWGPDPDNYIWIVLEFCRFGSLKDIMDKMHRTFEEREIAAILRCVLEGLVYLHAKHIVHSDLKCSNILISDCGQVKLSDFGISTQMNASGSCTQLSSMTCSSSALSSSSPSSTSSSAITSPNAGLDENTSVIDQLLSHKRTISPLETPLRLSITRGSQGRYSIDSNASRSRPNSLKIDLSPTNSSSDTSPSSCSPSRSPIAQNSNISRITPITPIETHSRVRSFQYNTQAHIRHISRLRTAHRSLLQALTETEAETSSAELCLANKPQSLTLRRVPRKNKPTKDFWWQLMNMPSPKLDIWAVGILAIEMGESMRITSRKQRVSLSDVSAPKPCLRDRAKWSNCFHSFVDQCCTKDPEQRPSASQLLAHQFVQSSTPGSLNDLLRQLRSLQSVSPRSSPSSKNIMPQPMPKVARRRSLSPSPVRRQLHQLKAISREWS